MGLEAFAAVAELGRGSLSANASFDFIHTAFTMSLWSDSASSVGYTWKGRDFRWRSWSASRVARDVGIVGVGRRGDSRPIGVVREFMLEMVFSEVSKFELVALKEFRIENAVVTTENLQLEQI